MKLIRTEDAVGQVLCHDITQIIPGQFKGARFRKGHIVQPEDIPVLLSIGKENLYVWEKRPGILHEDEAAALLYKAAAGRNIHGTEPKEGKIELVADCDGLLKIDRAALLAVNRTPQMMIATIHGDLPVKKGQKLAGTRIIPLVIEQEKMDAMQAAAGSEPILNVLPFHPKKFAVITTGSEVFKGRIEDKFTPILVGKLAEYGAAIVRLDAFAYAPKTPGLRNFMNEPDTWDTLERIRQMADSHGLTLLPEIHDPYAAGTYEKVARKGYMTYDFFLPGLVIDAIENHDGTRLMRWAEELREKNIRTVNMLGCHDGIPMLDLKGLLSDEAIEKLIALIVSRGGMIKNLHGAKNVYYQVNCTYFSALGADERKMLLARAIQLFMPGKPQVWYLDLFAGENDLEAVRRGGEAAHKEINRTNLTRDAVTDALKKDVVRDQLALLRMRNTCPAFDFDADMTVRQPQNDQLEIIWEKDGSRASLRANLTTYEFAAQTDCGAARTILTSR